MKNLYSLNAFAIIVLIFSLSIKSEANWISEDKKNSHVQEISNQGNIENNAPSGVTQDWFNSILDEKGNKIFPGNEEFVYNTSVTDTVGYNLAMTGEAVNNYFGESVSSAGDVNGDGYSDVVVGAFGNLDSAGRAYIFFGGNPLNNVADVTMNPEAAHIQFGRSVSSAGDVNGDGYSDVIVGAPDYSDRTGKAYLYFGSPSMDGFADITMIAPGPFQLFGFSVSTAGDVNNDGYSDVIVGANGYNGGTGRAFIFFGGSSMNNIADVIMTGEASNDEFGISVSSAGDVNGDGYSDVIVGARNSNLAGRSYIFFGGFSMNNVADVIMTGEASNNDFGTSVSSAGDVNGDGYKDVIVGAPEYSSITGRAYVFFGGSSMNNAADAIFTGTTNSYFGMSVSSADDVNRDGYSDVFVGAPALGNAYIYYGGSSMNNVEDVTMGGEGFSFFGKSVSSAGDFNRDGYPDVIAGAPWFTSKTGRAYIYLSPTIPASALRFDGADDYVALPNSLTSAATGGTAITIEYWFKGSSNQSAVRFQGPVNDFIIAGWNGLHIISSDGGTSGISVGAAATDGNWHHVAMTWQKNTVNGFKSYLDGNLVSQRNSANANLPALNFGGFLGSYQGNQEFLNGSLDEVRIWNRALPQYEIQTFKDCELSTIRPGLLTYYKFNHGFHGINNAGFTSLIDYSGNNYTATLNNFALTGLNSNWINPGGVIRGVSCTGQLASALNFDGVNDNIYLSQSLGSMVSGTTAITIEYWYKGTNNQSAVRFQVGSDPGNFIIAGWNGKHIISADGGTTGISQGAAATNGNWHHISMTWQSNTVNGFRSFLDGQLVEQRNSANVNLPAFSPIMSPTIGSFDGTQEYMLGSIDEVRIWNRALSQAEIQFRRNCEIPTSAPGLLVNYHFNQGIASGNNSSVTDLVDASGNNQNGTLFNFAFNGSTSNWISPGGVISGTTCTGGTFNITAVQEGFYNSANNTSNKRDTVRAYLHANLSPYNVVDSAKSVMDSTTFSGSFIFANAANGTYYIHLKHRNSIETWSKSGGEVYNTGNLNSYNFTTSAAQAFGSNMKQVDNSPVRFAIYGGDVNQDGTIDLTDIILCFNDANAFTSGYVKTDLNGDDFVDLTDITIAFNNSNNFVSKITP